VITAPGQTLLDAGLGAKIAMPFSCTLGGCGACKVKVPVGEVAMLEPNCLSADERAQGYVLACVSHAVTPCEIEVAS
jgi:ferredoxin